MNGRPQRETGRRITRRTRKRLTLVGLFIIGDALLFFFFKPVFMWNFGWTALPPPEQLPMVSETSNSAYETPIRYAEEQLAKVQQALGAPGISVAVAVDGELVWAAARGYKDVSAHKAMDLDTRLRVGSVSKSITAVGVARLSASGALDIDADIHDYVAYYPMKRFPLTTRQLLSHTGGIRHYRLCWCFPIWEYYDNDAYANVRASVEIIADDPLLFEPGTEFRYSSYGYNVVAAVIEGASKRKFLNYMESAVFKPLHMRRTEGEAALGSDSNTSLFFESEAGRFKEAISVDTSGKRAGGGFLSTPTDLVSLGLGILSDAFIPGGLRDTFFEPMRLKSGDLNPQSYALGFRSQTTEKLLSSHSPVQIIHHGGTAVGSTAFLMLLPEYGAVVSVAVNIGMSSSRPLTDAAYDIVRPFIEQ